MHVSPIGFAMIFAAVFCGCGTQTVKHEVTVKFDIPKFGGTTWEDGLTNEEVARIKPGWEAGGRSAISLLEEAFKRLAADDPDAGLAIQRLKSCQNEFFDSAARKDIAAGDKFRAAIEGKSVSDLASEQRAINARQQ